jgi:hypothetical protein
MWKLVFALLSALPCLAWAGVKEVPHPRLWMTRADQAEVVIKKKADPLAARLHEAVIREADRILEERTCRYDIPDGKRLLAESRLAMHHISHCAWAWRFTGEEKYKQRAIRELDAACALKDWNPSHFLDTAEMALAVAWGYDWLHDTLDGEQRKRYEDALLEKALRVADDLYRKEAWWTHPRNNWAQVCGAGIGLAAAAIAGRDEELTERLISKGVRLVESCHAFYQPDGMYPEGPGYWHYGTNYHVMLLGACERLGIAYADDPVLGKSGNAVMHLTGPTRYTFNFADAKAYKEVPTPAQGWIARKYADKVQARHVRRLYELTMGEKGAAHPLRGYGPLAVLWLPEDPGEATLPTSAVFRGEQAVAAYRTSWEKDGVWIAIKGGRPGVNHGQMDVGSFVYDAHGMRWFHELGAENYNLPGYFGTGRWKYYRSQNRSHNTLEIGGRLQNAKAAPSPLVRHATEANRSRAEFDLTNAYAGAAKKVVRTLEFDSKSGVVGLRDEIQQPVGKVVWRAFTDADAKVAGDRVVLTKNGKSVSLVNRSGKGGWSIESAAPPTQRENQNDGFRAITLTLEAVPMMGIDVEIRP